MQLFRLFEGVSVEKPGTESAPKWQKLFPVGVRHSPRFPGGKLELTREWLAEMVANWKAEGATPLQLNYFHRGTSDGDTTPVESKVAAGWIEGLELRDDGLWALVKWTARAKAHIDADELRYLSPEFALGRVNRLTGKKQGPTLTGCALLNDPFLHDMPRVAASDNPAADDVASTPEDTMNRTLLPALFALLNLKNDATEADINTAAEKLSGERVSLSDATAKLSASSEQVMKLSDSLKSSQEQVTKLSAEIETFKASAKTSAAEALAVKLRDTRKIFPAQFDDVKALALSIGCEQVEKLYAKAGEVVKLGEVGIPGDTTTAADKKQDEAAARFNAKVSELESKGMKFAAALEEAKVICAADYQAAFSTPAPVSGTPSTTA